jgi:transcriptional regulator with XRE-family HTH domain
MGEQMASDSTRPDSAVRKRRLRNELRKAREAAGMTQSSVAQAMDWSPSKLIRIETGAVNISTNDLRALLSLYEVSADRTKSLIELARAARETPRWNMYKNVASPATIAFLGYESSASIVRNFEPLLVPGLLQTEEYARTVIEVAEAERPQHIDALVDMRIQRQEILIRHPPTEFHFIMDESAIRRRIGGPGVTRRQLRHLREVAEYPNVTIRIVPFTAGMYPRLRVSYLLLEFPDDEDENVLYVESPLGDSVYREAPGEWDATNPTHYLEVFWKLEQLAPKHDSMGLIDDALAGLERASSDSR